MTAQELQIDTVVGRLHVAAAGSGAPVFVWPSLYCDGRSFDGFVARLADRRTIVVDGPGHGRSGAPPADYDLAACARAALQVLDALSVGAVDWVGNAWGGHVGVRAAVDHAARVRTLVVVGAPMEPLSPGIRAASRALAGLVRLGAGRFVGGIVAGKMVSPAAPAHDAHVEYVRSVVGGAAPRAMAQAMRCVSLGRPDLRPELPRIPCPTLFVAGVDDEMPSPALAAADAARVPHGRNEAIAAASHLAPLEQPDAFVAAVRAFWAATGTTTRPS
jgi:pimeloyl-ACP methyl ester carboxylesterase